MRFLINFCTNFTAQKQLRKQKQKQKRFSRLYNLVVYIICVPKNHNFKHFHVCISINFSLVQPNVKTLSSTKHQNHHYNKQYNRTPHCSNSRSSKTSTFPRIFPIIISKIEECSVEPHQRECKPY